MLRAGGHLKSYTPPSAQAMYTGREQFAMGGDLKVHRGEAETMSYNPYLPEGGETIMFRGPSHENGGMPIEYGSSPVEVEGGEPAVKLEDGTSGGSSLVVYGNLINPRTGRKFKKDAAETSKKEAKENKKINKASTGLDNLDVNSSFDKIALDTYKAIIDGGNMKLAQYAEEKMDDAAMQSAINDTAEENGLYPGSPKLIADDLAKGKVMMDKSKGKTAKSGIAIKKAQTGVNQGLEEVTVTATPWPTFEEYLDMIGEDIYPGNEGQQYKEYQQYVASKWGNVNSTPVPQYEETQITPLSSGVSDKSIGKEKKKFNLNKTLDVLTPYLNEALPYLRGTNTRPLPLDQILPELSVMGDREEPVSAQTLQPNLAVAFDIINPQADLNDVRAQANAAIRAASGDPSALTTIMAQLYDAENKIKGRAEQANLANKLGIYNQNLQTLNDTQLQNLNIRDKQYFRQAQAKSNTKAQKLLAAKSISDKFAQNRQANNTLGVYENLYNYRFDEQGRAQNRNPLVDFSQMIASATPEELKSYAAFKEDQTKKASKGNARNGSIVKALKNL
jgi:hypothetical protein